MYLEIYHCTKLKILHHRIHKRRRFIMATIALLQSAIASLVTDMTAFDAAVASATGAISIPIDLSSEITSVNGVATQVQQATATLTAAVNPPAPPAV